MDTLISMILAAGGLGFVNYYVSEKLDLIEFNENKSKFNLAYLLCWEVIDFPIFLILRNVLSIKIDNDFLNPLSLVLSIILIFILMLLSPLLSKIIYLLINLSRNLFGKSDIVETKISKLFFSEKDTKDGYTQIYIYDLNGNYINSGFVEYANLDINDSSIYLIPFRRDQERPELKKLIDDFKNDESYQLKEYVDFDKNIIFVKVCEV